MGDLASRRHWTANGALPMFLFFVLFVVRGALLWIVIPVCLLVWLVVLPIAVIVALLRLFIDGQQPWVSPLAYCRWGNQLLDGMLSRLFFSEEWIIPWPWADRDPEYEAGFTGAM